MKRWWTVVVLPMALLAACGSEDSNPASPPSPSPPTATLPPPPSPPPFPASNQPPTILAKISPEPAEGKAPFLVHMNLCLSTDPERDALVYTFGYGDGPKKTDSCRTHHTYMRRGRFRATACVTDGRPDHEVCRIFGVTVS